MDGCRYESNCPHVGLRPAGLVLSLGGDGCRYESNCPLVGPGTIGGLPSVGIFLRDPSPYLR